MLGGVLCAHNVTGHQSMKPRHEHDWGRESRASVGAGDISPVE